MRVDTSLGITSCLDQGVFTGKAVNRIQRLHLADLKTRILSPLMEWYYAFGSRQIGPLSEAAIIEKIQAGEIRRSTRVWNSQLPDWIEAARTSLGGHFPSTPPPLPPEPNGSRTSNTYRLMGDFGDITGKVINDLRELMPQFLMPVEEIKSMRWIRDSRLMLIAGIGLFPLVCLTIFDDLRSAYWALALYFSIIWALFLYMQFPSAQVKRELALANFFGTSFISISILLVVQQFWPVRPLLGLADSDQLAARFFGMFLGVAVMEELCKAMMVLITLKVAREKLNLQTLLFYGLMSGLGFGIYEGVSYQLGKNVMVNHLGTYYLLNVIRLTTLPFLHAVWTGIAGYLIGLSALYPHRKHGLLVAAILIPALLHSLHNTFSNSFISLGIDFLSVLTLVVYLRQSSVFETRLAESLSTPAPINAVDRKIDDESTGEIHRFGNSKIP